MKKLFTLLILILLPFSSADLQAQSIVGIWKSTKTTDTGDKTESYYFIEQSKYKLKYVTKLYDKELGTHLVTIEAPGTYTYNGKVFSGQYKSEDVKIDARLLEYPEDAGNKSILEALMAVQAKALLHRFFSKPIIADRWEVVSLTKSNMVLGSGETYNRLNDSSLTGTWKAVVKDDDLVEEGAEGREAEGDVWEYYLTFGQNARIKGKGELDFKGNLVNVTLVVPLIYSHNDNVLIFEPLIDQAQISVDKIEWSSETLKSADNLPQLEKKYKDAIFKYYKEAYAEAIPTNGRLTISPMEDEDEDEVEVMVLVNILGDFFVFARIDKYLQDSN